MLGAPPPRERADAARNRTKVLAAAAALFQRQGVDAVSMDAIAAEAGVGKGTLFRRFGDKSALVAALLDDKERDLQAAILSGPPPLGPGAPAADRVRAFVAAYAGYLFDNLDLLRVSETARPGARYRIGAYRFWHLHLAILLAEARPGADAGYLAHALLAPLGAEHVTAVLGECDAERITSGLAALVDALVGSRQAPP
ncbi:TetR/AcrR family transcriptional regulator [Planotetraspora sp. A-T 1434]|uniref:TetR/AcrR family transcriptional regulator n=1 Tax=Planotetraspora sp. A-T 1434 TaxID=2979219 RepID=UPI0021C14B40|nr:TetR/AcrR family transcriptional regulator [Planotetraspora sp. A-T 1434]MCT9929981.1 TetR/AcrR family transcriptional regulator [Planotetraspora sp. A-T 1434]